MHPDRLGQLLIIEDVGGATTNVIQGDATSPKNARQPNSFVYRFVPVDKTDLSRGGKLQALNVTVDGTPVEFGGTSAAAVETDAFPRRNFTCINRAAPGRHNG